MWRKAEAEAIYDQGRTQEEEILSQVMSIDVMWKNVKSASLLVSSKSRSRRPFESRNL